MATSNAERLSHGLRVYEKKRKAAKARPDEVVFDLEKRREYLTGFHKRKVEKHDLAVRRAKEREKRLRIETRKARREELAKAADAKLAAYRAYADGASAVQTALDGEVAELDSSDASEAAPLGRPKEKVSEFRTSELLTTVTVEEMGEDDGFGFGAARA